MFLEIVQAAADLAGEAERHAYSTGRRGLARPIVAAVGSACVTYMDDVPPDGRAGGRRAQLLAKLRNYLLAGIIVTIWCGLRGWPKDEQRTVFQPVGVAVFAMSAAWLGASGAVNADTIWLFLIGVPVLLAGTWLGLRLYGRVDDAGFRKIVLALLLTSGAMLILSLRQMDLVQWSPR